MSENKSDKPIKYYQAIDLEATSNTDIVGIGYVIGDSNGVTKRKREWWLKLPEGVEMDKRCKEEFWDKNPELKERWDREGKDEDGQIKDFVEYYDQQSKSLGIEEGELKPISDNPEFDYGRLARYVKKHCNREPLRYTTEGKYRSITDIGEATWGIGVGDIVKDAAMNIQKHNHFPSDDAEHIFLYQVIADDVLDAIKQELGSKIREIAEHTVKKSIERIIDARKAAATADTTKE